jgi:predicted peptidase
MKKLIILLFVTTLFSHLSAAEKPAQTQEKYNKGAAVSKETIDAYESRKFKSMPYRFLAPIDYDPSKKYPLILSLHGRAGVGNDNLSSLRNWTEIFVQKDWRQKYPCFVIAPQSMASWSVKGEKTLDLTEEDISKLSKHWQNFIKRKDRSQDGKDTGSLNLAFELVDDISKQYSIDKKRIYVLGHSMGGFGSWNAIYQKPKLFAAAIPSAGGLPPWKDYTSFKRVPIWAFHGSVDPIVPVELTMDIFDAMKKAGGNMKYTELKDVNHGAEKYGFAYTGDDKTKGFITNYSSKKCDKTNDVWQWLFRQKLK